MKRPLLGLLLWTLSALAWAVQPTLVSYANSDLTDTATTDESVAGVSWQAGDVIVVYGGVSNNEAANLLATPTATGLTFALVTSVNNAVGSNDAQVYLWSATAAGTSSATVSSVTAGGISVALRCVIAVFVFRGTDGIGTPVVIDNSTAKTISITRAGANSHVAEMMIDWANVGDVTVTATPAGTVQLASSQASQADFFVVSFGDQGATGTTAYGIASHTGTVDMSGIAVEIKGTAGGGATQPPRTMHQFRLRN